MGPSASPSPPSPNGHTAGATPSPGLGSVRRELRSMRVLSASPSSRHQQQHQRDNNVKRAMSPQPYGAAALRGSRGAPPPRPASVLSGRTTVSSLSAIPRPTSSSCMSLSDILQRRNVTDTALYVRPCSAQGQHNPKLSMVGGKFARAGPLSPVKGHRPVLSTPPLSSSTTSSSISMSSTSVDAPTKRTGHAILNRFARCSHNNWIYHNLSTNTLWKECGTTHQRDREIALYSIVMRSVDPSRTKNILRVMGAQHRYRSSHTMSGVEMFRQLPFLELERYKCTLEEAIATGTVFPIEVRLRWLRELAAQLKAMHDAGVVHCMVAPWTIVMVEDPESGNLTPKLSDWSCAIVHNTSVLRSMAKFTLTAQRAEPELPLELQPLDIPNDAVAYCYPPLPPEVSRPPHNKYHPDVDVYGLGRIFTLVLLGMQDLPTRPPPDTKGPVLCWVETRDIIASMTQKEPRARISLRLAQHHPVFWSVAKKVRFVLLCAEFTTSLDCTHTQRLTDWLGQPNHWQNHARDWFHALADENTSSARLYYDFTWGAQIEFFRDVTNFLDEYHTPALCGGSTDKFHEVFLCERFPLMVISLVKWFLSHPVDGGYLYAFLLESGDVPEEVLGLMRPAHLTKQ
eukprot:PhM_4_TR10760/c0_g1_i1/m.25727